MNGTRKFNILNIIDTLFVSLQTGLASLVITKIEMTEFNKITKQFGQNKKNSYILRLVPFSF